MRACREFASVYCEAGVQCALCKQIERGAAAEALLRGLLGEVRGLSIRQNPELGVAFPLDQQKWQRLIVQVAAARTFLGDL